MLWYGTADRPLRVLSGTPEFFFVKKISNYILLFEIQLNDVMYNNLFIEYEIFFSSCKILRLDLHFKCIFVKNSNTNIWTEWDFFFWDQNILVPYRGFFQIIDGITSFSNNHSALQLLNFKVN